jgi:penicillin amidase
MCVDLNVRGPERAALLILVLAAACGRPAPERRVPPLPQTSGTLAVAGLAQPVRVVRDRWGVPHVYAQSQDDLFFAQGFVQAQDRLFQMDLWRRSTQGRLSEVLGPNFIDRDAMTRRVAYRGDMTAEWASYGSDVKSIAVAFVRGVNAWVAIARQDPPQEFALAGWRPQLWNPEDVLNRTDAFLASGDAELEAFRLQLIAAVGDVRANVLLPGSAPYKSTPGFNLQNAGGVLDDALRRIGTTPFFSGFSASFAGSNAWAVAGPRTSTGGPLLASDPHRPLTNPSLRYLIHLQAPGWNVIGAASPWLPGVVIGHNEHVAWGMAAYPADTQDISIEQVNPFNAHEVQAGQYGRYVPTTIVKDPIVVKGEAKPFAFEREYTSRGVVIASDREHSRIFTLNWSGFEPGAAAELAALALDRAQTALGLRAALAKWKMPVVDVVFADTAGLVGHQVAGLVPVRPAGAGQVPAIARPLEWTGWKTLDDLPRSTPKQSGVVVAANESVARTRRLNELLGGAAKLKSTVDDMKRQQHDVVAWNAEQLIPRLAGVNSKTVKAANLEDDEARRQLLKWDRRLAADSTAATLYVFWEEALWQKISERRVPAAVLDGYLAHAGINVAEALKASDALLLETLSAAVDRLRKQMAAESRTSAWGALHRVLFRHPLAITQASRRLYNVGPFEQGGYADTVMSSVARPSLDVGAAFRQVVDVSNWDRAAATNAPGQSEWPRSAHFSDLAKLWAAGEYFPLSFSDGAVQANTEWTLTLVPH